MNFQLKDGVLHHTETCSVCKGQAPLVCSKCLGKGTTLVKIKPKKPTRPDTTKFVRSGDMFRYSRKKTAYTEQTRLSTLLTEALGVEKPKGTFIGEEYHYDSQVTMNKPMENQIGPVLEEKEKLEKYNQAQKTLSLYNGENGIIINLK